MKDKEFKNKKEIKAPSIIRYNNEFASYRHPLTLNEARVFTLICMQMGKGHKEGDYYRLPWANFKELIPAINSKNKLLSFLSSLMDKRVITDDKKTTNVFSYISKARFNVGGYVDIAVHSEMVDLITNFKAKNFSTAHFPCLFTFKSEHAWRLYFVLAQRAYKDSPPLDLTIERLKFHLDIDADSPTYKNFGNLRTKILNTVKESFKRQSNFNFTFKTLPDNAGRGVRVTGVRFLVKPSKSRQITVFETIHKNLTNERDSKVKSIEMVEEKEPPQFTTDDVQPPNGQYSMLDDDGRELTGFYNGADWLVVDYHGKHRRKFSKQEILIELEKSALSVTNFEEV